MKNGRFQYYKKCDGGDHEGTDERKETFQDQHCRYLRYLADQIMGAQKIIEAKQKKGLLCNKLYTSPNVSKNYTPAV